MFYCTYTDKSKELCKSCITWPVCATGDNDGCNVIFPASVILLVDLSGKPTIDVGTVTIFDKQCLSFLRIYVFEAPLSNFAFIVRKRRGLVVYALNVWLIELVFLLLNPVDTVVTWLTQQVGVNCHSQKSLHPPQRFWKVAWGTWPTCGAKHCHPVCEHAPWLQQ